MDWLVHHLAILMFAALAIGLFTGFPVGFVLGGLGVLFGVVGIAFDVFVPVQFLNLLPRIWGGVVANQVLVAIPMFVFMGTVLERSGVAQDLLHCLRLLTSGIPGGLAMSVTLMGTIMAAATGIVGASVIMLTVVALPTMLNARYRSDLAVGTVASAGTLGILIPPSIMLVVMGDLLQVSVGALFAAALVPGLLLASLYLLYIGLLSWLRPAMAPALPEVERPAGRAFWALMLRGFLPPVSLIALVLGSIYGGWATPTEAVGVGSAGALLLAWLRGRLSAESLGEAVMSSGLTNAMVFFLFCGAALFSYVFRALGGDEIVRELVLAAGIDTPWKILIFTQITIFLLGFFFDWIEISLIVLPIFAPLVLGIDLSAHVGPGAIAFLTWFVIIMAVNLQTSFLTPPFGFALFCIKAMVPPSVRLTEIYRGIVPFTLLQLAGLSLTILFPGLVLWLPRTMGLLF